ncbi:MAG: hypothetical protein ACREC3_15695 [Methyloceanibacter sp.]
MRPTQFFSRATAAAAALVFAIAMTGAGAFAAGGFVGKWKVEDTKGEPFTIWLSDDGTAKGDRSGEGLSGMWKERGQCRSDHLGLRLGDEDHQGRRQLQEDRL